MGEARFRFCNRAKLVILINRIPVNIPHRHSVTYLSVKGDGPPLEYR